MVADAKVACADDVVAKPAARPNFIVVFCDNLGYGDIQPFGSTVHRTPHLNRMAMEGRRFTHFCVTAGVCTPSRSSLITGCYAQRVGMHDNPRDGQVLRPISPYGLNPDEVTIAEVLRDAGYATGMVGKWHLGDQKEFLPTRQGFDWFYGIPYSDDMTAAVGKRLAPRFEGDRWPPLPLMENDRVIQSPVDRDGLTRHYTDKAIGFIQDHQSEPFFLYLPQAMPGSTRTPFASPQFKGKSNNGPWGDSIEELDWSMGKILDELVRLKIDRQTLVIWTSDNGAPMDRDMTKLTRGTNRPLHGRGYTTSEGAFRVPTLMWWPGTIPANSVCTELATTMDLLPTFVDLGGDRGVREGRSRHGKLGHTVDGKVITDLIKALPGAKSPYEAFYYYERDQLQAVRSGPWKLFVPLTEFVKHPHYRTSETAEALLFNVVTDVGCKQNVAGKHPAVVRRLMDLAQEARKDLGDRGVSGAGQRSAGRIDQPVPLSMK
ncbi:sulfatase [Stieleria marina]